MVKKILCLLLISALMICISACGNKETETHDIPYDYAETTTVVTSADALAAVPVQTEKENDITDMMLMIEQTEVTVVWEKMNQLKL